MVAHRADYSLLSRGEQPLVEQRARLLDRLDVSDLVSERDHGYQLFDATAAENRVFQHRDRLDAGRAGRRIDRFLLRVEPGGAFVLRAGAIERTPLVVKLGDRATLHDEVDGFWQELALRVPEGVGPGTVWVEVRAAGALSILHYWSYAAPSD